MLATSPRASFQNQRVRRRWPRARITAFLQCPVTTSLMGKTCSKKSFSLRKLFEKQFSNSWVDRRCRHDGRRSNHCIFTVSRATARIAAYLQCRRARGHIIHCKNAVILCRVTSADRRSEHGAFSPSWGLLWCPQRPQEKVLKIRGPHQSSRQLESLHFYSVP